MKNRQTDFWLEHLKAWRISDMSNDVYCAKFDLNPTLFSNWKSKLYKLYPNLKSKDEFDVPVFLPVSVREHKSVGTEDQTICIELSGSLKIHVGPNFDEPHLKRLINAIKSCVD